MPKWYSLIMAVVTVCVAPSCSRTEVRNPSGEPAAADSGVATVCVVNYPLQYFAQRIGGEHARVVLPAPTDQDPAFWKPGSAAIAEIQQADLILLNGASYEKWIDTVSLPMSKTVDTSAGVKDQYIEVHDAVTHAHGPGGEHAHGGTAFTTWLDPQIAISQAEEIHRALVSLMPQHRTTLEQNLASLVSDLHSLDEKLDAVSEGKSETAICFSHPVYQYLQRRYGLNSSSVHWEPGEIPPSSEWQKLAKLLEEHPAKWMLWEGEPLDENVKRLEELGVQSTVFDPCGNRPEQGDFLTVMHQNVDNLAQSLGQ